MTKVDLAILRAKLRSAGKLGTLAEVPLPVNDLGAGIANPATIETLRRLFGEYARQEADAIVCGIMGMGQ